MKKSREKPTEIGIDGSSRLGDVELNNTIPC
jgi:hypothetical protein